MRFLIRFLAGHTVFYDIEIFLTFCSISFHHSNTSARCLVLNTRFWNNNATFNLVIESEVVVDVSSGYFSGCDGTNNSSRTGYTVTTGKYTIFFRNRAILLC